MKQQDKLQEDLQQDLEKIHDKRKRDKRPGHFTCRRSKIARYHAEVVQLRKLGASYEDIRVWLRRKHLKVQRSTIYRYLKQQEV